MIQRSSLAETTSRKAKEHPVDLYGLEGDPDVAKAHLPSCAGAYDPGKLFCEATDE